MSTGSFIRADIVSVTIQDEAYAREIAEHYLVCEFTLGKHRAKSAAVPVARSKWDRALKIEVDTQATELLAELFVVKSPTDAAVVAEVRIALDRACDPDGSDAWWPLNPPAGLSSSLFGQGQFGEIHLRLLHFAQPSPTAAPAEPRESTSAMAWPLASTGPTSRSVLATQQEQQMRHLEREGLRLQVATPLTWHSPAPSPLAWRDRVGMRLCGRCVIACLTVGKEIDPDDLPRSGR